MFFYKDQNLEEIISILEQDQSPLIQKSMRVFKQFAHMADNKLVSDYVKSMVKFKKRSQYCNKLGYALRVLQIMPTYNEAWFDLIDVLETFDCFRLAESCTFLAQKKLEMSSQLMLLLVRIYIRYTDIMAIDQLIRKHDSIFLTRKELILTVFDFYTVTQYLSGMQHISTLLADYEPEGDVNYNRLRENIKNAINLIRDKIDKMLLQVDLSKSYESQSKQLAANKVNGMELASIFFWYAHHKNPASIEVVSFGTQAIKDESLTSFRVVYSTFVFLRLSNFDLGFMTNELNFDMFKRFQYHGLGYELLAQVILPTLKGQAKVSHKIKSYYDFLVFDSIRGALRKKPLLSFTEAEQYQLLAPYNLDLIQLGSRAILEGQLKDIQCFQQTAQLLPVEIQEETLKFWQEIAVRAGYYNDSFWVGLYYLIIDFLRKRISKLPQRTVAVIFSGQVRKPEVSQKAVNRLLNQLKSLKSTRYASFWDKQGSNVRSDVLQRFLPMQLIYSLPEHLRKAKYLSQSFPTLYERLVSKEDTDLDIRKISSAYRLDVVNLEAEEAFEAAVADKPGLVVKTTLNQAKMYFQIWRAFELVRSQIKLSHNSIIRIRPDLDLSLSTLRDICIVAEQKHAAVFITHFFPNGLGDQFAVGSPLAMDLYSGLWQLVNAKGQFRYLSCFPPNTCFAGELILQYHLIASGVQILLAPSTYKLISPKPFGSADYRKEIFNDFQQLDIEHKDLFWPFYQKYLSYMNVLPKKNA